MWVVVVVDSFLILVLRPQLLKENNLKLIPENINPNSYLPYAIPGIEIIVSVIVITIVGGLSLSFLGKRILKLIDDLFKRIPFLRTIYSAILQMTETFSNKDNDKKRINILKNSNDGFQISEEDMKIRGFGDILGFKQSGVKSFRLADPIHNHDLFELAENEIRRIEKTNQDIGKFKPLVKLYDRADIINDIA